MTWHFFDGESIECPSCSATFIPFENEHPCPRCGTPSTQQFSFLDDVVAAMRIHKSEYGSYTPQAYYVGSTAESVFHHACNWLDAIEEDDGQANESTIATLLDKIEWGDNEYMQNYFQLLLCRAAEKLAQEDLDGTHE